MMPAREGNRVELTPSSDPTATATSANFYPKLSRRSNSFVLAQDMEKRRRNHLLAATDVRLQWQAARSSSPHLIRSKIGQAARGVLPQSSSRQNVGPFSFIKVPGQ